MTNDLRGQRGRWLWLALALAALIALGAACAANNEKAAPGSVAVSLDDDESPSDDDASPSDDDASPGDPPDDAYWPPNARGPYAVGVITVQTVDKSRWENWGGQYRGLPLEIWYPSTGNAGTPNKMGDMVGDLPEYAWPVLAMVYGNQVADLLSIVTTARRNDEPLAGHGRFPVLLFSHGISAIRFQNYSLCEHLASHGFVVVAPDHYDGAIFANMGNNDLVLFDPMTWISGIDDRPPDVNFIHDYLENLPESYGLINRIPYDIARFAVLGHSYGGLTSMLVGPLYAEYVRAIAPLNPAWAGKYPQNYAAPFFMLQSGDDEIVGGDNSATRRAFDQAASKKKIFVNVKRGSHYSVTDACVLLPWWMVTPERGCGSAERVDPKLANEISWSYLTAFFKTVIAGDERYLPYLQVNHYPTEMDLEVQWPK